MIVTYQKKNGRFHLPFLVAQTLSKPILPILYVYLQCGFYPARASSLDVKLSIIACCSCIPLTRIGMICSPI